MKISVFDVIGPVMIGPSSSHTAGAARLSYVAASIVKQPFSHISFGLHGSFAKTCLGHGTDRALVAGALGIAADDERLPDAFAIARQRGVTFDFHEVSLDGVHDNSVCMDFTLQNGEKRSITGSSVGGGQIAIKRIDELEVELDARFPTLIITQRDRKGVLSGVTGVLYEHDLNIAVMKVSRVSRGDIAITVIETDGTIGGDIVEDIENLPDILSVQALNLQ